MIQVLCYCFRFCVSCFKFCVSVLGFAFVFQVLCYCFRICDSVLFLPATVIINSCNTF